MVEAAPVQTSAVLAGGQAGQAPEALVDEANVSRVIDTSRERRRNPPRRRSHRCDSHPVPSAAVRRHRRSRTLRLSDCPETPRAASLAVPSSEVLLSDHVVFNDEKLARRYAAEPIPISTLYEAYFDGSLDIPGDLVEFLQSRNAFVKHTITRQHLQWAVDELRARDGRALARGRRAQRPRAVR